MRHRVRLGSGAKPGKGEKWAPDLALELLFGGAQRAEGQIRGEQQLQAEYYVEIDAGVLLAARDHFGFNAESDP